MKPSRIQAAILANIHTLHIVVEAAYARISEAAEAMEKGQQNQAIGSMGGVEQDLETALALYRAAIALHRRSA
jgi:exonuclease VII small subunit